jgi:hypothetical protein
MGEGVPVTVGIGVSVGVGLGGTGVSVGTGWVDVGGIAMVGVGSGLVSWIQPARRTAEKIIRGRGYVKCFIVS